MATNLNIDIDLLQEAYKIGNFKTKREAVNVALKEFIQRKKQKDILKFFDKVEFDPSYDYKGARKQAMKFLVDTSVWSESLRRKKSSMDSAETILSKLILNEYEIVIVGIVLQEILSGITDKKLFAEINTILADFPYIEATKQDYVFAAELRNLLKTKGVTAGSFDFLIAVFLICNDLTLVTLDQDFTYIAEHTDLKIFDLEKGLRNGN